MPGPGSIAELAELRVVDAVLAPVVARQPKLAAVRAVAAVVVVAHAAATAVAVAAVPVVVAAAAVVVAAFGAEMAVAEQQRRCSDFGLAAASPFARRSPERSQESPPRARVRGYSISSSVPDIQQLNSTLRALFYNKNLKF